jgi:hypothetical protein
MSEHEIKRFAMFAGTGPKPVDPMEATAALDLFFEAVGCSRVSDVLIETDYQIDYDKHRTWLDTRYITVPDKTCIVPRDVRHITIPDKEIK